ncbi:hypothetical protein ABVL59_002533 [Salmonella enterica]|nr:hypothetical protein [Salmonella enterica]EBX7643586.1 hypothetical protein [Salmonella enterica subsp. enterica serovar Saintpaul]ECA7251033.1 hypothetical protein [Salmonella enterica subsp. enterica serovar Oranienburg]ECH9933647.1 hypothetical protein [Salmonella enterica subsp. houtenae]EDT0685544.1 hypothetical protein [Salmonella enterica subsp. enterica serovar Kokomlemle]EDU5438073.1 hypothetical protein [Salmonella enterica subsp. enterica serovar Hadar]EEE1373706.1 hypothetical 
MTQQSTRGNARQERWIIDIQGGLFFFTREINGQVRDSYAPVKKEKAAVFAAAITQGIEPPRLVTQADQGSRSPQDHRSNAREHI